MPRFDREPEAGTVCILRTVTSWSAALDLADCLRRGAVRAATRVVDGRPIGGPGQDTIVEVWAVLGDRRAASDLVAGWLKSRDPA